MSRVAQREMRRPAPGTAMPLDRPIEGPSELASEFVDCVTRYARANPGYTALWCMGIGFVLGWKLKPW